jgi:hypothetical protein
MPLALDDLKIRLGIAPGDTTKDAAIVAVAAQAQALCEAYCDRKFDLAADDELFDCPVGPLLLRRWPLDATEVVVADVEGRAVPTTNYVVDRERGIIRGRAVSWVPGWSFGWSPLRVTYAGGFEPGPPDLTWSVANAFDIIWSDTPGGGLEPGQAGGPGEVRKFTIPFVYSVEATGGAPGEVGTNEGSGWGPLSGSVVRGLDIYRRESRLGAG